MPSHVPKARWVDFQKPRPFVPRSGTNMAENLSPLRGQASQIPVTTIITPSEAAISIMMSAQPPSTPVRSLPCRSVAQAFQVPSSGRWRRTSPVTGFRATIMAPDSVWTRKRPGVFSSRGATYLSTVPGSARVTAASCWLRVSAWPGWTAIRSPYSGATVVNHKMTRPEPASITRKGIT